MAVSLPQDVILFQIITRVPTKSVIRFKCVSKQWNLLLTSGRFKEMHNRNLLKDPHVEDKSLLFYTEDEVTFLTIDCESPPDNAPCYRPLPFEVGPPGEGEMSILTSYHGLVCLRISKHKYQDGHIILWNPLTTEYKRLSKPINPDHMECYKVCESGYGLYYSSCEDDYKLLVLKESGNVYIYSLKSDSWRKLNKTAPFEEPWSWRPGFRLSKNIYFHCNNIAQGLIRFDTTVERFHKIDAPPECDNTNYPHNATTAVHRGSLHLCCKYDIFERPSILKRTCIELWKFDADEDILSKVETYQLMPKYDIQCLSPLHMASNGNWLMIDDRDEGPIRHVELKKKYTGDKDGHDEYKLYYSSNDKYKVDNSCYYSGRRGFSGKVRYTETFVSPNRYMK